MGSEFSLLSTFVFDKKISPLLVFLNYLRWFDSGEYFEFNLSMISNMANIVKYFKKFKNFF